MVTLGPATFSSAVWPSLVEAGATMFRIPFAKETPDHQFEMARSLWEFRKERYLSFKIFMDLPGAQPRTRNQGILKISSGSIIRMSSDDSQGTLLISNIPVGEGACVGAAVIFGDGEATAQIVTVSDRYIDLIFEHAAELTQQRRVTIQGSTAGLRCLSPFDESLVLDARTKLFDGIMLSFVKGAADVAALKGLVKRNECIRSSLEICAKMETLDAVANAGEIAAAVDLVLIARGDLLLQVGVESFFESEIAILRNAKAASPPARVLWGTGALDSFGRSALLARSEISSLAAFVSFGIDGVLLSAETTIGPDPVGVVVFTRSIYRRYGSQRHRLPRSAPESSKLAGMMVGERAEGKA
jgi:pyruvate kinase